MNAGSPPDAGAPGAARRSWWPGLRLRLGGAAVADQVLSSGTQLLLLVLVARTSSATILGALSVATLVHGFCLGSMGGLVGDVALIRCRRARSAADGGPPPVVPTAPLGRRSAPPAVPSIDETARTGLLLAVGFGTACGLAFAAVALVLGGPVGHMLLVFALAEPIVLGQDLLRSVAYGSRRVGHAARLDGLWMAVQVAASIGLWVSGHLSATTLVLAWIGGALASLLYGLVEGRLGFDPSGIVDWLHDDGRRGVGFLGDHLVSTGVVQASFLAVGALMPLAEFAAFRLAFVAVNPLANLMAGVRDLNLARVAGAHGDRALAFRRARSMAPVFAGVAVAYGVAVTVPPASLGVHVLGHTWRAAHGLVGVVALGEVFRLSGFPAVDFLKVQGTPGALVRTRVVASLVLVPAIVVGGVVWGPHGAVWAAAGALAVATAIWWRRAAVLAHPMPPVAP